MPDVADVAFGDAVVNQLSVKVGQVQVGDRLNQKER